jgi:hypothetical protein
MNRQLSGALALTIVAALTAASPSHSAVTWDRTFGGSGNDQARTVLRTDDGGFVIGGTVQTTAGDLDIRVVKVDANGNTVWQNDIGGAANDECFDIIETLNGDFVLAGKTGIPPTTYNGLLVRIDDAGTELWQESYGGTGEDLFRAVYETGDGDLVAAGDKHSGDHGIYLVRADSDGGLRWENALAGPGDYAYGVAKSGDGAIVIAGYRTDGGLAPDTDALLVKATSTSGAFISETTYDHGVDDKVYAMTPTPDGHLVIAGASEGKLALWKVNSNGGLLWRNLYGAGDVCTSVDATASGFLLSGYYYNHDGLEFQMVVVEAAVNGTETASAELGGALWDLPGAVTTGGNGDFVVAGYSTSFGAGGYDWYVVRGDFGTDVSTGVGDIPVAGLQLRAAPNPFNPQTRISYTVPSAGTVRLVVYDVTGRRVATLVDGDVGAGTHDITWAGEGDGGGSVASGVYFARLETATARTVYKLVVAK